MNTHAPATRLLRSLGRLLAILLATGVVWADATTIEKGFILKRGEFVEFEFSSFAGAVEVRAQWFSSVVPALPGLVEVPLRIELFDAEGGRPVRSVGKSPVLLRDQVRPSDTVPGSSLLGFGRFRLRVANDLPVERERKVQGFVNITTQTASTTVLRIGGETLSGDGVQKEFRFRLPEKRPSPLRNKGRVRLEVEWRDGARNLPLEVTLIDSHGRVQEQESGESDLLLLGFFNENEMDRVWTVRIKNPNRRTLRDISLTAELNFEN